MWDAVVAGTLLVLVPWIWGWVTVRRDWFVAVVTAQMLVYAFLAPAAFASGLDAGMQESYGFVFWEVALAFVPAFWLSYFWWGPRRERDAAPNLEVVPARFIPVVICTAAGAVAYLAIALSRDLLFRRLGHAGLAQAQLDLPLLELAIYRTFIELGPWMLIVIIFGLQHGRTLSPLARGATRISASLCAFAYGAHALANSRLYSVLFPAFVVGLVVERLAATRLRRRGQRLAVLTTALVLGLYSTAIVENVRANIDRGGALFDPMVLVPGAIHYSSKDVGAAQRLNGIDLIVKIRPGVEAEGPAYGTAWILPFLVTLDPIVRTELTQRMKGAALTTSKSMLLLRYAGVATEDYYNCVFSDAYGNFAQLGLALAGLVLGAVVGVGARWMRTPRTGAQFLIGSFLIWRALPFEQEFSTLLFGWLKLVPVVWIVVSVRPFATMASAPEAVEIVPGGS
jgi:hypothetical protein